MINDYPYVDNIHVFMEMFQCSVDVWSILVLRVFPCMVLPTFMPHEKFHFLIDIIVNPNCMARFGCNILSFVDAW